MPDELDGLCEPFALVIIIFFTPKLLSPQLRLDHRQQFSERYGANVLRIHPQRFIVGPVPRIAFMEIEYSVRAADRFERKILAQLVPRLDLFAIRRRPAQQYEKIAERRRNKTAIEISRQRKDFAVLAFGKLGLVRGQNQRQVGEFGSGGAEQGQAFQTQ